MNTNIDFKKIRKQAEEYYLNRDYYCSEAVVKVIKDAFELDVGDEIIAAASGFPLGIGGTGCCCGAITGGVMAIGLVFGRTEAKDKKVAKAMKLSKKLIDYFKKKHKSTCCRVLIKDLVFESAAHKAQCASFTGEVAEETARIILKGLK